MIVLKRCSKCKELKERNDLHFRARPDRPGAFRPACRECEGAADKAAYETGIGRPVRVAVEKLPTPMQLKRAAEERATQLEREREREIVGLIRRYEAVRFEPGHYRRVAYDDLAHALRAHGKAVRCGDRYWSWDKDLGELKSNVESRTWREPEDRHADPCRVAWESHNGPLRDMVEFQ